MLARTIFIVPFDAQCRLTDDGWLFSSEFSVQDSVVKRVIEHFGVQLVEEFLGIRKFQFNETQIDVVLKDDGSASEVVVRTNLGSDVITNLSSQLTSESVVILDSEGKLIV